MKRQPLPQLWIVSDQRNDAALEQALKRLPRGSGLVFRHYHLAAVQRRARFRALARLARARGQLVALAGSAVQARRWGADAAYGNAALLARGPALPRLVTVHSLREIGRAVRAAAVMLSPVHATRSHPGVTGLGALRFRLLAARAKVPTIALGGMNQARARQLEWPAWAGIDAFLR